MYVPFVCHLPNKYRKWSTVGASCDLVVNFELRDRRETQSGMCRVIQLFATPTALDTINLSTAS